MPEFKPFYEPGEITDELVTGIIDERQIRLKPIMAFVDPVSHATEEIKYKVLIQQKDRFAAIQGFSDSSVKIRGAKGRMETIAPFHIKNSYEYSPTGDNAEYVVPSADKWAVTPEGLVQGTNFLESARENTMYWAFMSMVNDKQFTYEDADKKIVVPFSEDIGDLTVPGTMLNDPTAKLYLETNLMKQEYFAKTGQVPDLVFLNGQAGAILQEASGVKETIQVSQLTDLSFAPNTFRAFTFNGITFVILHSQYPDGANGLKSPVADGRAIVTVANLESGGRPFKFHRGANKLNRNNSSKAFYDTYEEGQDPYVMGLRLYDNGLPGVAKKDIVQHWQMWS